MINQFSNESTPLLERAKPSKHHEGQRLAQDSRFAVRPEPKRGVELEIVSIRVSVKELNPEPEPTSQLVIIIQPFALYGLHNAPIDGKTP